MKDILWSCFETAVNYYQGFIMVWFVYRFLNPKSIDMAKIFLVVFSIAFGTAITILNHICIYESFASVIYFIILFVYSLIAFDDKIIKRILSAVIPNVLLLLITSLELNMISSIFKMSIVDLITRTDIVRFIALVIIQASIWVALKLVIKLFKFSDSYTFSDWSPIITMLIFSFILVSLLHVLALSANNVQRIYINMLYLCIFVLNLLMFQVLYSLYKKNDQIKSIKLWNLKEKYITQFVDDSKTQYDSIRKIRHGINNQLVAVYSMLSDGETEAAMNFIEQSTDVLKHTASFVQTNSLAANAIINSKLTHATAIGAQVSCISANDLMGINEIDLCDLLSNILDNAVTACENLPPEIKRFISLKITEENGIYTILIKNSISESVLTKNPKLKTTKNDKKNHGFGISIIKDIVRKYNGRLDYYESDDAFCCYIVLKV